MFVARRGLFNAQWCKVYIAQIIMCASASNGTYEGNAICLFPCRVHSNATTTYMCEERAAIHGSNGEMLTRRETRAHVFYVV